METQLRVRGHFCKGGGGEELYEAVLMDGDFAVDVIVFGVKGTKIQTANDYPKTAEGARQQAKDYWF